MDSGPEPINMNPRNKPLSRRRRAVARYQTWREAATDGTFRAVVLMALSFVCMLGFFVVLDDVFFDPVEAWDLGILQWLEVNRNQSLDRFFWALSTMGDPIPLSAVGGVLVIFFFLKRKFWYAAGFLTTVCGGLLLNLAIKGAPRDRPPIEQHMVEASGSSFPSGHAMVSVCFYGFLAYITFRQFKKQWQRVLYLVAIAVVVIFISCSRLYVGVHYPTDIIAGWLAGLAWLFANITIIEGQRLQGGATLRDVWWLLCGKCGPDDLPSMRGKKTTPPDPAVPVDPEPSTQSAPT